MKNRKTEKELSANNSKLVLNYMAWKDLTGSKPKYQLNNVTKNKNLSLFILV